MWRWIARQKQAGNSKGVHQLKVEWLHKRGIDGNDISNTCFFCEYSSTHKSVKGEACPGCPGDMVDPMFECVNDEYHFRHQPIKFYNKLVSLNRKRGK